MKLMSWALLLGAAAGTQMTATAQTTQATPWDNKTYEWTDAEGITHTANLTDKATDPRQIQALLGAVYTDPTVPGQNKHNEYLEDGTPCEYQLFQRNINYDDHAHVVYHYTIGPDQRNASESDIPFSRVLENPGAYFKPNGFEWEATDGMSPEEYKQYINNYYTSKKDTQYAGSSTWDYIDWIGERTEPVPNPVEGMTVLLVEVKDTWKQTDYSKELERAGTTLPFIESGIKSVQLMTQWMRVNDETNPGYIFLADEVTTNRFFFLSKGRTRRSSTRRSPFGVAYEIVSPRKTQLEAEKLNNGQVERVKHDCYSVFQQGATPHYVELDGNEASALSKLTLFMPDKRFRGLKYDPNSNTVDIDAWDDADDPIVGTKQFVSPEWNYQNPTDDGDEEYRDRFKPGMLLYKAFLTAEATPSETDADCYDIKLDWRTWFDASKLYTNVGEQYYVYILKNDGSWQLLKEVDAAASAGMGETTTQKTFTYPWPQTDQVQTFTYMITANPIDGETVSNIFVNSNTATVIIPGTTDLFINASDYRSRFAYDTEQKELNVYRNRPVLMLNSAHVHTNKNYSLHRIAIGENGAETDTEVASLQFTEQDKHNHIYGYTITYMNQNLNPIFDDQTTTDMTVTGSGFTIGQGITLVDRFTASTADNSHPGGYAYVVRFKDNGATVSNRYDVPVFKSKCVSHFAGFTRDQVDGDDQHQLVEESEVWVDFTVTEDRERTIERYDVHRVNPSDDLEGYHARIGKAECTNDNNLVMIGINHESRMLSADLGAWPIQDVVGKDLRFYDDSNNCPFDNPAYVTEIFAGTRDWQGSHTVNTYGTNISRVGVPQLSLELEGKPVRTEPFGRQSELMGYSARLKLTPDLTKANNIKNVYYYRIWRVEDDGSETLLNTLEDIHGDQEVDEGNTNFVASYGAIRSHWLSSTDPIQVVDTYTAGVIPVQTTYEDEGFTEGGKKDVTYIARMYSTVADVPQSSQSPSWRRVYPEEDPVNHIYYVTEKRLTVTYDYSDNVITAVDRVMMPSQVVSTNYYNLMGVSSDTPHRGINIVVTVHADGTVTSHKAMY